MLNTPTITPIHLRKWLTDGKKISIIDIRPVAQCEDHSIPQAVHMDVYERLKHGDTSIFDHLSLP